MNTYIIEMCMIPCIPYSVDDVYNRCLAHHLTLRAPIYITNLQNFKEGLIGETSIKLKNQSQSFEQ